MLTRDEAINLLKEENPEPGIFNHALASEAVLRELALHLDQPDDIVELWAMTGLLHDVDYPRTKGNPFRHGLDAAELIGGGLPEAGIYAIKAHNGEYTGVAPKSQFDYALRCGETVTGLITAASLVRPAGIEGMEAKSLKKKMKDKAFAASVNREIIKECEHLGLELTDFLNLAIKAMSAIGQNQLRTERI